MVNIGKMMKQAQKMQSDMMKVQEEVGKEQFEGSSGGGMVKVTVTGAQEIVGVNINPEVVDPEDVEMLEDLITAATNQALKEAQDKSAQAMKGLTGGMNIPGLGF